MDDIGVIKGFFAYWFVVFYFTSTNTPVARDQLFVLSLICGAMALLLKQEHLEKLSEKYSEKKP